MFTIMKIWKKYPELFHYTNQQGLMGILDSQSLHATHYRSLNDASELARARPHIETYVKTIVSATFDTPENKTFFKNLERQDFDDFIIFETNRFVNALFKVTLGIDRPLKFFQPYIVSFCGHKEKYHKDNGLLSQWRGYSGSAGYAISFDTKKVSEFLDQETDNFLYDTACIRDVVYDDDSDKLDMVYHKLKRQLRKQVPRAINNQTNDMNSVLPPFAQVISRVKHHAFREENEIRLIVSPLSEVTWENETKDTLERTDDKREIKEIFHRSDFSSYLKLFDDNRIKLPINRIIISPHRDMEFQKEKLSTYLEIKRMDIEVTCSETPLV